VYVHIEMRSQFFYNFDSDDIDKWLDTSNFLKDNKFRIEPKNKMKLGC
jgi:hypothetical protein